NKIDQLVEAVDGIPRDVWAHLIGKEQEPARSWLRGGNLKAGRAQAAAQDAATLIAAQGAALDALTAAVAAQQGVDVEELRAAVRRAVADAVGDVRADVTLTLADPDEEVGR